MWCRLRLSAVDWALNICVALLLMHSLWTEGCWVCLMLFSVFILGLHGIYAVAYKGRIITHGSGLTPGGLLTCLNCVSKLYPGGFKTCSLLIATSGFTSHVNLQYGQPSFPVHFNGSLSSWACPSKKDLLV